MESITTINNLNHIICGMCVAGGIFRYAYCQMCAGSGDEQSPLMKKRAKHTIGFLIVVTLIWSITEFAKNFYGG